MDLQSLIQQLSQSAGPRGSTFAGRVIPQGQTPTLKEVMLRLPTESPDAEGMGVAAATAGVPALRQRMTGRSPNRIEMPQSYDTPSPYRALNQELDGLVEQARKSGISNDTLISLRDQAMNVLDEARRGGKQLPVDAFSQIYAEGLRRILAPTIK